MMTSLHMETFCVNLCKLDFHLSTTVSDQFEGSRSTSSWEAGGLSYQQRDSRFSSLYSTRHPFLQLPHTSRTFVWVELSSVPAVLRRANWAPIRRRASETSVSTGRQLDTSRLHPRLFIHRLDLNIIWNVKRCLNVVTLQKHRVCWGNVIYVSLFLLHSRCQSPWWPGATVSLNPD